MEKKDEIACISNCQDSCFKKETRANINPKLDVEPEPSVKPLQSVRSFSPSSVPRPLKKRPLKTVETSPTPSRSSMDSGISSPGSDHGADSMMTHPSENVSKVVSHYPLAQSPPTSTSTLYQTLAIGNRSRSLIKSPAPEVVGSRGSTPGGSVASGDPNSAGAATRPPRTPMCARCRYDIT